MGAGQAVTAIYERHALGLTRLAFLMLGDRQTAEDVVQEAFCGLYRAWDHMSDHAHALGYVRSSVLNGSRSALRRSRRVPRAVAVDTTAPGISLAAASKLATLHGAGGFPWPFITPDGTKLIGEMVHRPARTGTITVSGALGVYSARTGTLLQVIGRWQQRGRGPGFLSHARQAVVWSDPSGSRLIVEMPRGKLNEVGILTGDKLRPLAHVARAPLLTAISSGGFQTSGGYVGFAW
jgi:hypothetical protein